MFAVANILSAVIFGEHARCQSASLGEEQVTIVVITVHSGASVRPPALFPEILKLSLTACQLCLDSQSVVQEDPALKERGSRRPAKGHAETSVEVQVDQRSIAPQAHCPLLQINILEAFFSCFPIKFLLLLGKVNDGTSSEYKCLCSALTKCLL